ILLYCLLDNSFPLIISILILSLSYFQFMLNIQKRKDDLFIIRYNFYKRVEDLWLKTSNNNFKNYDLEVLIPLAAEADLLFGNDISNHILSLANKTHYGSPQFPNEDFTKP